MENSLLNVSNIITQTINNLFSNLFSSIDNNLYNLLDDLLFINSYVFENGNIEKILGDSNTSRNNFNM